MSSIDEGLYRGIGVAAVRGVLPGHWCGSDGGCITWALELQWWGALPGHWCAIGGGCYMGTDVAVMGAHYLGTGVAAMWGALSGHWSCSDGGCYLGIGVAVMGGGGITWALVWQ